MTVWLYNLPPFITNDLLINTPLHAIRTIYKAERIPECIRPNDALICMWMDERLKKILDPLDIPIFPDKSLLTGMFSSRIAMTQFVDKHSHYPAERDYVMFKGSFVATVPRLKHGLQVVAKVGEAHQGQNKYLLYPGQILQVRDSVIFEEFVPDAISIRVLIMGDKTYVLEYQDDPVNPRPLGKEWIKNINPIIKLVKNREAFQSFIHDAIAMSQILRYDYLGVDYVVSKDRSICLEINPFPGISVEVIRREAQKYWLKKVKSLMDFFIFL